MASFPRLSLDFVKADLAKSAAQNFLRIRVFHVDLLSLPLLFWPTPRLLSRDMVHTV
jgi:hypothetical protein